MSEVGNIFKDSESKRSPIVWMLTTSPSLFLTVCHLVHSAQNMPGTHQTTFYLWTFHWLLPLLRTLSSQGCVLVLLPLFIQLLCSNVISLGANVFETAISHHTLSSNCTLLHLLCDLISPYISLFGCFLNVQYLPYEM